MRASLPRCLVAAFVVSLVFALPVDASRAGEPDGSSSRAWVRPVDGPLVRSFEAPASVYGAGHRGADLVAAPGTPVRVAGSGEVSFAGTVAGTRHVTVTHAGGLRTTYSFLASTSVRAGEHVERGDVVGTTGGATDGDGDATSDTGGHSDGVLHFALRLGDRYLDPMLLFRPVDLTKVVRLAPVDPPDERPWTAADERRELAVALQLPVPGLASVAAEGDDGCDSGVPFVGAVLDGACEVGTWLGDRAHEAVDGGIAVLHALTGVATDVLGSLAAPAHLTIDALRALPPAIAAGLARTPGGILALDLVDMGRRFVGTVTAECSDDAPDADGTGGSAHRVMVVAGINSSGPAGERGPTVDLDVAKLGYHRDEGEVRWFSYADDGGPYAAADTHGPIDVAAQRLGAQLREMQREQPGREVDLIAHSQGGVVVDVFLARHYDPADPELPPLGTVVTVSSPHEGAPLATTAERVRGLPGGRAVLDAVPGVPPPNSDAVADLSERSATVAEVQARGVPEHFDVTSIGATEDAVVPATNISLPGAQETVVAVLAPNEHSAVLADTDGLRAIRAGLEGRAPPCVGLDTALRSAVMPVVISRLERGPT